MLVIYRIVLPILLIVFVLMGLWVSFLDFSSDWVMYIVMGLEVLAATMVLAMEYQAQSVGGASGWGIFGFFLFKCKFSFYIGYCSCVDVDLPKNLDIEIQKVLIVW